MKYKSLSWLLAAPALALTLSVQAHDPKEHMKDTEQPDCAAMKDMDHSKMDMNDPVMQAMMKKCMGAMHGDQSASDMEHGGHDADTKESEGEKPTEETQPSEHQH
jgi:hypothetical protein